MPNGADRRRALRIAIYINLLGHDPISFKHSSYGIYEFALMEQFAELGQRVGHKRATEARKKGDTLVARQGLIPTVLELFGTEQPEDRAGDTLASTIPLIQYEPTPGEKRIERQRCRRKLRHPNLLSALKHAAKLEDPGLNVYECEFCDGLHLGHATSGHVSRNRRIDLRLQELAQTLKELDDQRFELLRERRVLLHERGESPLAANRNLLKQLLHRILPNSREVSVFDPNEGLVHPGMRSKSLPRSRPPGINSWQ
jgi:hypothetical protein